ncbi:hypothetical protein [Pontivivens ytuae]|uniref:Uncharacterized protein n=1 Tax=Pontivivens ytuae TaxID=2789856 RepID=A0A7S9QEJ1_9RHOB|nr:hypothetical protein [Pontivivens ytuae]QPH56030.1 hypothetical protein I0K15_10035 [Pontivivens ytuae]
MSEMTVVANLYKSDDATYSFRLRWVLGQNEKPGGASEATLPLIDDVFLTSIQQRDKTFLQRDLTWGAAKYEFETSPMLDVMLDPPRRVEEVRGLGEPAYRREAQKPTKAVDPGAVDWQPGEMPGEMKRQIKDGEGFGVRHLLENTDRQANYRVVRGLTRDGLTTIAQDLKGTTRGAALRFDVGFTERVAGRVAEFLVSSAVNPFELADQFAQLHRTLAQQAQDRELLSNKAFDAFFDEANAEAPLMERLGLRDATSIPELFSMAAMLQVAFSDEVFCRALKREAFDPEQVRRQLKLKALQGGRMIDFWAQSGDPVADDSLRGEIYSASRILGLGIDIHGVAQSVIEDLWASGANPTLLISASDANGRYTPAKSILHPDDLQRARDEGIAFAPRPPKAARLNFDLNRADPKLTQHPNGKDRQFDADEPAFKTGNGAVEVHITPRMPNHVPRDKAGKQLSDADKVATETAFNIYAVPEGSQGMEDLFSAPDAAVSPGLLKRLRPYLVTRRYSYQRDLHGAFPDLGGAVHPKLKSILETPPWEAVPVRPRRVRDFSDHQASDAVIVSPEARVEDEAEEIPEQLYGGPDGPTIYSFDLRMGGNAQFRPPAGLPRGWDARAERNYDWAPDLDAAGEPVMDRPLAYRLFVTSVDSFDTESAPLPVLAADPDVAVEQERYLFFPTYRSQIRPVDQITVAVEDLEKAPKLVVNVAVPDQPSDYGLSAMLKRFEDRGHPVVGELRIFRRRVISSDLEDDVISLRRLSTGSDVQWRSTMARLGERGWTLHESAHFDAGASARVLRTEFELEYKDLGFEYVAAVLLSVPDAAKPFWSAPTDTRRMLQYLVDEETGDRRVEDTTETIDAPSASTVGVSEEVVSAANPDQPRAPDFGSLRVAEAQARPVIPIPGMQRDPILARIAMMPNRAEELPPFAPPTKRMHSEPPRVPWRDTGLILNEGQAASADAALLRARPALRDLLRDPDFDIGAPALKHARRILAESFLRFAEFAQNSDVDPNLSPEVGLHPSVGFRGILLLGWTYTPHIQRPPGSNDAEATAFDVFQAIVPDGSDLDKAQGRGLLPNSIAAQGSAVARGNGYDISITKLSAGDFDDQESFEDAQSESDLLLEQLVSRKQPLCGVFVPEGIDAPGHPFLVSAGELLAGDKLRLNAQALTENGLGTGLGTVCLFYGDTVAQMRTKHLDGDAATPGPVPHNVMLPVRGGAGEYGFWWIVSRSGANRRGNISDSLSHFAVLPDTVEPETPTRVTLGPALDRKLEALDPNNPQHADFLPKIFDPSSPEDTRSNPRLVLAWAKPRADGLLVVIDRQEEAVDQEDRRAQSLERDLALQLNSIEEIRTLPSNGILEAGLIEPLMDEEKGWLLGNPPPVDDMPEQDPLVGLASALNAQEGLSVKDSNNQTIWPADAAGFIDYRQSLGDPVNAMSGNLRYRYQLRFAVPPANGTPALYSPATAWTEWMVPEAPPIQAVISAERDEAIRRVAPAVRFRFSLDVKSQVVRRLAGDKNPKTLELDWKYRIVVRRRVSSVAPSEEGSLVIVNAREVGRPIEFNPTTSTDFAELIDTNIERQFEDDVPELDYDIYVQQFALSGVSGAKVERPVRSHEETPTLELEKLKIPITSGNKSGVWETMKTVDVKIS